MRVPERGLPNTPLDKSTPPAADQMASDDGTMYGDTETGAGIESGDAGGVSTDDTAQQQEPRPTQEQQQQRGGFFDWLLGRNRQQPAVPASSPPPPPPGS